jgi:trimethylamine--corrinoid protein Co-methyltransferase
MRTGAYTPGAIETGILHMGFAQMARFYNLPSGGYIGLTNAKANDAQSGYETGMSTVAALLGGAHVFNMTGLLDSLMAFDFAKAVIDDEIALMLKRLQVGFSYKAEDLALETLAQVGPGGNFIDHEHTLAHMRSTPLLTRLADRHPRASWEAMGEPDVQHHAMKRAQEILSQGAPSLFSPEREARLRGAFGDLPEVAADLPGGLEVT